MKNGISYEQALAELTRLHRMDDAHADRPGMVNMYDSGRPTVEKLATDAFGMYLHVNALYSSTFPSVFEMERDMVAQVNSLLHAPSGATGSWTSGGSESCMMAVKAARDAKPQITRPKMVLPISAHAAWWKAAHYLGLRIEVIPIDPVTYRTDVAKLRAALDDDTVIVVQSAPQYTHGAIDPIAEVAKICKKRGIWLQVDACIGGWVLPYIERLGHKVPPWDFRVDGVCSITVDPQKYGYTSKGCSLVLYRERELRRPQFYVCGGWSGYPVANSTVQSSKPGGLMAAGWAVMRHIGDDGYLELVKRTLACTRKLIRGVKAIEGLQVLGTPASTLVAVRPTEADFFAFLDEMSKRGWALQPALSQPGIAPCVHFTMAPHHGEHLDALLQAMREAVAAAARRRPLMPAKELARLKALPADTSLEVIMPIILGTMPGGKISTKTSVVIDALPVPLRERAMLAYYESLTAPAA